MRYLVSAAVLAVLNIAMWALLFLPRTFPLQPGPRMLAGFGILAGVLMLACLVSAGTGQQASGPSLRREAVGVIAVAAALLSFGVLFDKVEPLPAALVLICGAAALLIGLTAAEQMRDGRTVELTSHWGGLGGSLGGWRISPLVITIMLALIFLGATVTAGLDSPRNEADEAIETNETAENGQAKKEANDGNRADNAVLADEEESGSNAVGANDSAAANLAGPDGNAANRVEG